jgi:EAL domain-containing protein (putative c-di-GMP-specific phosphodiesterase class I)
MVEQTLRILLVEDDEKVAQSYCGYLELSGFLVDVARDGTRAVELLKRKQRKPYDVIVSDIRLPDINGMVILERVRAFDKEIPFIFTTAYPSMESAIAGINQGGIYGYLVKPVDPGVLIRKVQRAAQLHMLQRLSKQAAQASFVGNITPSARLSKDFDLAIETLWMAYQPIISAQQRRVLAYEALVRNDSPALRSPPDLIDAARSLGRLHELGRHIRASVASDIQESAGNLQQDVLFFVNINPDDLSDPTLTSVSSEPLLEVSERVVFEVTERSSLHAVANLDQARDDLRRLGYRVAVDDLGQGHAGLNSLVKLDPEYVKLDMQLIRDIHHDERRQKIVGSMFQLCKSSNMGVIAEGVETKEEHNTLLQLGADLLQGYLYARPAANFPLPNIP